jgi:hypothetical protein
MGSKGSATRWAPPGFASPPRRRTDVPAKDDLIVAYLERRAKWERDAIAQARQAAVMSRAWQ